jgi:hypothetical protein
LKIYWQNFKLPPFLSSATVTARTESVLLVQCAFRHDDICSKLVNFSVLRFFPVEPSCHLSFWKCKGFKLTCTLCWEIWVLLTKIFGDTDFPVGRGRGRHTSRLGSFSGLCREFFPFLSVCFLSVCSPSLETLNATKCIDISTSNVWLVLAVWRHLFGHAF